MINYYLMESSKCLWVVFVVFCLFLFVGARELNLVTLSDDNAQCLDGSSAGYYFDPAPDSENKENWIIYMEWGGWCYELSDCAERATTSFGTSILWNNTKIVSSGPMTSNSTRNPTFSSFNRVYIPYCDGASFSGNVIEPVEFNGTLLYFKGKFILDSVFRSLIDRFGFSSADSVLITGSSAGGLSTFLHADYIKKTWIPSHTSKYKVMPDSGFFLDHQNLNNVSVFAGQMNNIVRMQNCSLPENCIAGKDTKNLWKCFLAPVIYESLESPIFIINSVYDLYQTQCILTEEFISLQNTIHACSAIPGWYNCAQQMNYCSDDQISILTEYKDEMIMQLSSSTTNWNKKGNGAFLYSCYSHKAMTYPGNWNIISVHDNTMQQAVSKWWNSENEELETSHVYLPCTFRSQHPYNCNPSCWPTIISKY